MRILFLLFALLASFLFAATDDEFRGEAKAKIENLQKENSELKAKINDLDKDLSDIKTLKPFVDKQNDRIGDINFNFNVFLGFFTIVLSGFGIFQYRVNIRLQSDTKKDLENFKQDIQNDYKQKLEEIINSTKQQANEMISELGQYIANMPIDTQNKDVINTDKERNQLAKDSNIKEKNAKTASDFIEAAKLAYFAQNYGDALRNIEKALANNPSNIEEAKALYIKGASFYELNKSNDAIATYDELINKYQEYSLEDAIKELVAKAMYNKSMVLVKFDRHREIAYVSNELIKKFKDSSNENIKAIVIMAMVNNGNALNNLNKHEEAIAIYDELINKNKDSLNEAIKENVVLALNNKGILLDKLNKYKEAIAVYDELINKYEDSLNDRIKELIAESLNNKGISLNKLDKGKKVKQCFLQAIKRKPDYLYSYINLFKICLLLNESFDNNLIEQFKKYAQNDKIAQLKFSMLQAVQDSKNCNQIEQIAKLKQEFAGIYFGDDFKFEWLENLAKTLEDNEQNSVMETMQAFKNWDAS